METVERIAHSLERIGKEIEKSAELPKSQSEKIEKLLEILLKAWENNKKVFFLGTGISGNMGGKFAIRLSHMGFNVFVMIKDTVVRSTENGDIVIAVSGSGETDTVESKIRKIRKKNIQAIVIVFTADPKSMIARLGDLVIQLPGIEDSDSKTKKLPKETEKEPPLFVLGTLFEICVAALFDALVPELMRLTETTEEDMKKRHET
ncbi:SIS domain-containing protein [Patescibacteria group bacterium]